MIIEAPYPPHVPIFINSIDGYRTGMFPSMGGIGQFLGPSSVAWPAANLALYIPIRLPWNYPVNRIFVVPGAAAGNADVGIFSTNGTKLVSTGAFALTGVSTVQYQTVSWLIPKGAWYMGISLSATTAMFASGYNTLTSRQCGILQQSTAHPLPATMVGVTIGQNYWPLFGLTRTTTGF